MNPLDADPETVITTFAHVFNIGFGFGVRSHSNKENLDVAKELSYSIEKALDPDSPLNYINLSPNRQAVILEALKLIMLNLYKTPS